MRWFLVAGLIACAPAPREVKRGAVYERHAYYLNFVPFGAGQFQNGERTKGALFGAAELATGATSFGIWAYLTAHYRGRDIPAAEAGHVRTLQQTEIVTGACFLGLYAWGVVDALLGYEPLVEITPTANGIAVTWRH